MSEAGVVSIIVALVGSAGMATIVNLIADGIRARRVRKEGLKNEIPKQLEVLNNRMEDLGTHLNDLDASLNDLTDGQRVILQDKIEYLGKAFIRAGQITLKDKQNLKTMHKVYHDKLNGNGNLDDIMEDVEELPVIY